MIEQALGNPPGQRVLIDILLHPRANGRGGGVRY